MKHAGLKPPLSKNEIHNFQYPEPIQLGFPCRINIPKHKPLKNTFANPFPQHFGFQHLPLSLMPVTISGVLELLNFAPPAASAAAMEETSLSRKRDARAKGESGKRCGSQAFPKAS